MMHHRGAPKRAASTSVTYCLCHGVHVHLHEQTMAEGQGVEFACALYEDDEQALELARAITWSVEERRRRLAGIHGGQDARG